jgi:hypothetical protein
MRKTFVLCLCLFVLALALCACGGSSNTGTAVAGNTPVATSAPAKHFSVGQLVKVGDTWQIDILSAKTSTGSQFMTPKAGNVYLIVTVSMKNISSQEQNVSSLAQFNLADQDGQKYTETLLPDSGATLDGKVEAGSPLKGNLAYEIPKGTHFLQFSFQNDVIAQGQTIWDIHI